MATRKEPGGRRAARVDPGAMPQESRALPAEAPRGHRTLADRLAGPLLGFSLNGFFVYLGLLDVLDVSPRRGLTGAYYLLLGSVIAIVVWTRRAVLVERVRSGGRVALLFAVSAASLLVWLGLSALLFSEGELSRRLGLQLVLWTVPTLLLALSLDGPQLRAALLTVVVLGLVFAFVDLIALLEVAISDRFSPIAELDPITAGQICALAAVALLPLGGWHGRAGIARLGAVSLLVACAFLPGSRGPVLALAVAALAVCVLSWRATGPRVVAALLVGAVAGALLAQAIGSARHFTSNFSGAGETGPISSTEIRKKLLGKALRAVPDRPLQGHGVGTLVDDTVEAKRMGIAGRRTYPHNTFVEAAYSAGVPGLALLVAALAAAAWGLLRLLRRRGDPLVVFAVAFFAFAFVNANVSNELAADAWLWSACGIAIALAGAARLGSGGRPVAGP